MRRALRRLAAPGLLFTVVFTLALSPAFHGQVDAAPGTQVTLAVDGQAPVKVAASLVAGTVYLPAEGVARALGVASSETAEEVVRWQLLDRVVTLDWNAGIVRYGTHQELISPPPRQAGNGILLPVSFVAELFDLQIQWEPSLGTLALIPRDGQPRLRDLSEPLGQPSDSEAAAFDVREVSAAGLSAPTDDPPERRGDLDVAGENDTRLEVDDVLNWSGPKLQHEGDRTWTRKLALDVLDLSPIESIRMRNAGGRMALEIAVRGTSDAEIALLTEPDRLMVDLDGAILDADVVRNVGRGPVKRVRAAQTSLDTTRVVLDLDHPTGYDLKRTQEGDGWLVLLQNQVRDVALRRGEGRLKLYVKTSSAPDYETKILREPLRLVMDFKESTLVGGSRETPITDSVVRAVRVSQFSPDVVRVVLDLENEVRSAEVPFIPANLDWDGQADLSERDGAVSPADPSSWDSAIAFELLAPLRHVTLTSSGQITELTLASQGSVKPQLFYKRDPTRLIIDIPGVFLDPAGGASVNDLVNRLNAAAGGVVTGIEVDADAGGPGRRVRLSVLTDGLEPYEVTSYDNGQRAVVRIGKPDRPKHLVVVDPGHGGIDPGAIGPDGAFEKDYTLDISMRLKRLLEEAGIGVALTRTDDHIVDLAERPKMAERLGADLFISVHINSAVNAAPSGTATLFSPILPENRKLARTIQRELVRVLGTVNRGLRARPELAVLRRAVMPAVLVEVAFIQNPYDGEKLKEPEFRQQAASGIFNGILAFLGVEDQGEGVAQ